MNTEQFFEGPGASAIQTYVWEIAFILLGAFILGYLLRLMLNSKYKTQIDELENEISVLKAKKPEVISAPAAAAPFDTTEFDTKIRDQRSEIDRLNLKLSEYVNAKISAESALNALKLEMDDLKSNINVSAEPILNVDTKMSSTLDAKVVLDEIEGNAEVVLENSVDEVEETSILSNIVESVNDKVEDVKETTILADIVETVKDKVEDVKETTVLSDIVETAKDKVAEVKEEVLEVVQSNTEEETKSFSTETPAVIDNLKKIEGIGPKIESLLNEAGIYSYKDLKEAKPDYIREVLVAAGPNYAVHDPATWSEQATLANNGNWDALARLQEVLKGGKRK